MANLAGLKVFDAWCDGEPDGDRRAEVASTLLWVQEHSLKIMDWPAVGHPRRREVEVSDAGVILVFVVWDKPPVFGLQLVSIEDIEDPEPWW